MDQSEADKMVHLFVATLKEVVKKIPSDFPWLTIIMGDREGGFYSTSNMPTAEMAEGILRILEEEPLVKNVVIDTLSIDMDDIPERKAMN